MSEKLSQSANPLDAMSAIDPAEAPDPTLLADEHPADVADMIESLDPTDAVQVLEALSPEAAAHALEEMQEDDAHEAFEDMDEHAAAEALQRMAPDDAVDLLEGLDHEQRLRILSEVPADRASELLSLMSYAPESAGGVMSPELVALSANLTAAEAIDELRRSAESAEQIYYAYVVDHQHRLVGVLSLRDLILARSTKPLHEIMSTRIVSVPVDVDQEEAAGMLRKYGYYALPVVGPGNQLVGIITSDDVMDIMQEEATEDMQVMVGAGAHERVDSPIGDVLRARMPWLLVNLLTAFLAAAVISLFEATLAQVAFLAVLMPIVASQAGNTGAQSMAVVIRGIATDEMRNLGIGFLVSRNAIVGGLAGDNHRGVCGGAGLALAGAADG
jgi:magnesium transporter